MSYYPIITVSPHQYNCLVRWGDRLQFGTKGVEQKTLTAVDTFFDTVPSYSVCDIYEQPYVQVLVHLYHGENRSISRAMEPWGRLVEDIPLRIVECIQQLESRGVYSFERLGDYLLYLAEYSQFPLSIQALLGERGNFTLKTTEGIRELTEDISSFATLDVSKRVNRMEYAVREWIRELTNTSLPQYTSGYHLRVPVGRHTRKWWKFWSQEHMVDSYSAMGLYDAKVMPHTLYQFPENFRREMHQVNKTHTYSQIVNILASMLNNQSTSPETCMIYFDGSLVGNVGEEKIDA